MRVRKHEGLTVFAFLVWLFSWPRPKKAGADELWGRVHYICKPSGI